MKRYHYTSDDEAPENGRIRKWALPALIILAGCVIVTFTTVGGTGSIHSPQSEVGSKNDGDGRQGRLGFGTSPRASSIYRDTFTYCDMSRRETCVIDGDTFWLDGAKIRIADIDTPETRQFRCPEEKALGEQATRRLIVLLNAGEFQLAPIGGRDEDQYGRKLRVVLRDGKSLGDQLVREGLARTWTGRREPWC